MAELMTASTMVFDKYCQVMPKLQMAQVAEKRWVATK